MSSTAIQHWCWCGRLCTSWCSRCERQWYCSAEHLEADWPRHKAECGALAQSNTSAQVTVQAMMFPVDGERPKLVPVTLRGHELPNGTVDWSPRLQSVVGHESEVSSMIITKGIGGETLRFPLHIFFRTHFLTDGSRTNNSVYGLTHGQANYQWKGPIVALKFTGTRQSAYTSISMSDLPPLVYFMTYLNSRP
ncbi:hypothetical protein RSOLAG1IB_04439 [Rhizoctonia solani AG-1 IB]|uniref:MYND-type domain-containing protein n=1 Tax=Thanatephorus cucumeris (strain AG1-IB / isolate 7/3/14) TaxID=1108050 RepID=A0A0B7FXU8_THACB|nr:hypothetical protein RSOLAG1IB_04439 [Rhizoctonia solani AG-1 IB]